MRKASQGMKMVADAANDVQVASTKAVKAAIKKARKAVS
jgi:hypothetical protein